MLIFKVYQTLGEKDAEKNSAKHFLTNAFLNIYLAC